MFTVITRASSANLGPGFDCIGACLTLKNTVTFVPRKKDAIINGVKDRKANDSHLVVQSLYYALEKLNATKPEGYEMQIRTCVPISRGLGSSACCIGAGVGLAFLYAGVKADKDKIFEIACEIEGHPDNVAPNIYGGAVITYLTPEGYKAAKMTVDRKFRFIALIPNFKLSTKNARKVLPENYTRQDAVFNASHAALLAIALSKGRNDLLKEALEDRMHQPYREPLIPGYETAKKIALECGAIGTYLSGAGPTVMAVSDSPDCFFKIKSRLKKQLKGWQARQFHISHEGLRFIVS